MFRKLMDCVEEKRSRRKAVRGILTNKRGISRPKSILKTKSIPKIGYTHFTYLLFYWPRVFQHHLSSLVTGAIPMMKKIVKLMK